MAGQSTEAALAIGPNSKSIIIGLDFGTTYSGAVWAHSERPDELHEIDAWPQSRINDRLVSSLKVPTQLRYLANDEFEWGSQIPRNVDPKEVHKLFKLALEPTMFRSSTDALGEISLPRNVGQIITDFMSGMFKYVLRKIYERLGREMAEDLPIHVVITVPIIWSDLSKQRTLEAFRLIPNLPKSVTTSLLSEPEAAAISALGDFEKVSLKAKDTFIVVDAGGGTVDLVTYTVASPLPLLKVREATEATGDFCGSSLVDLRFQRFLTAKLQNEPRWGPEVLHEALDRFEKNVKRIFSLASLAANETYNIPVPGLARNVDAGIILNSRFSLKAAELHMCYERDVLRIIQLVKEQITMCDKPVRSILLVGGFGASTYLRERIEQAISEDKSIQAPIAILQPQNAWLAVARGAAMSGITQSKSENYDIPVVLSRTARKHYGYECGLRYNAIVHESMTSKIYWDALYGDWRVRAMVWFIKRGEDVSEDFPFSKTYYYHWPVGTDLYSSRKFRLNIYADEISQTAPIERTRNVTLLCSLTADLSSIPDDRIDQRLGADGGMHYYIEFSVEAVYHSASTKYTFIHKGKRYDSITAEYV
ncbi:hypothetical protein GGR58DRAFT_520826 [Xylaria digitata]|nr:hypothetical protein GGR58DRAFT_520826 [Xylaria digitata]